MIFFIKKIFSYLEAKSELSTIELSKIEYGLEALYLNVTKLFFIIGVSIILNLFYETVTFLFFFNNMRMLGFGVHALKSWHCWISSLFFFIGLPFIAKYAVLDLVIVFTGFCFCFIVFLLYAPADTINRPIIYKSKRLQLKIGILILTFIYMLIAFSINEGFLRNCLLLSTMLECFFITPLAYRLFNVPYKNYINYKGGDTHG